jgi:DNA-binding transcriptional regulator YdaS (Cro superfamily)
MDIQSRQRRQALLQQMERIEQMEHGALAEEYRPAADGGGRRGPYFKHQQWKQGRNVSRRVPAEEAPALREAIEGRQHFEELARAFVDVTVAGTRAAKSAESKKNSSNKSDGRGSKRPKAS